MMNRIVGVMGLAALIAVAGGCTNGPSDNDSEVAASYLASLAAERETQDAAYEAAGFTRLDTAGDVYFKFLHEGDTNYRDCGYSSGSCAVIEVAVPYGCDYLYVEANFENESGVVVDYSNDVAQNLGADDHAVLDFVSFEDGVSRVQLTGVTCN